MQTIILLTFVIKSQLTDWGHALRRVFMLNPLRFAVIW